MSISIILFSLILAFSSDKPKNLEDLRWKNRIVLFFQDEGASLELPDSLLSEMEERKIAILYFQEKLSSNIDLDFDAPYIQYLEKKYRMGTKSNCWVLIGLDGGVKMRREEGINWPLIFGTIDAMPMRQSEIRGKNGRF